MVISEHVRAAVAKLEDTLHPLFQVFLAKITAITKNTKGTKANNAK